MDSTSVVIPARNRAAFIGRALASVLTQTVAVSEIIVVDDASDDGTSEAALRSCPACRVIRLAQQAGAQAARAAGIRAATGEWVAFLDSDDWWLPQKLEWQLAKAQEGFSVVHGPGFIRRNGVDEPFVIPPLEGDIYAGLLKNPAPLYPCLLVRRECFEKAGYPDPAITACQEWDMSLLLARHYSFGYVDHPLFVYEVQQNSISKDDYRGLRGYEQIVSKWWPEILRVAGEDAGFAHYRAMAAQAKRLTGLWGYWHFMRLGAQRTGKNLSAIAAADWWGQVKHLLATKIPLLRTAWHRLKRKRVSHD